MPTVPEAAGPPETCSCPCLLVAEETNREGTGLRPGWTNTFPFIVGVGEDIPAPFVEDAVTKLVPGEGNADASTPGVTGVY